MPDEEPSPAGDGSGAPSDLEDGRWHRVTCGVPFEPTTPRLAPTELREKRADRRDISTSLTYLDEGQNEAAIELPQAPHRLVSHRAVPLRNASARQPPAERTGPTVNHRASSTRFRLAARRRSQPRHAEESEARDCRYRA